MKQMSKIKYIKTRFTKISYMMNNYTEGDLNLFQKIKVYLDLTYCIFRYGAGINDYFQYQFYKKKHYDRRKFIVHRKRMKIVNYFNTAEGKKIFDSKVDFNKKYKALIGRDWLDISTVKYEEFEQFVLKHQKFIVKPVDGSHGKGIRVFDFTKDELQLEDVFYDLRKEN